MTAKYERTFTHAGMRSCIHVENATASLIELRGRGAGTAWPTHTALFQIGCTKLQVTVTECSKWLSSWMEVCYWAVETVKQQVNEA